MSCLSFKSKGDFNELVNWLNDRKIDKLYKILHKYGDIGVSALSEATPVDTGLTAKSWGYKCWVDRNKHFVKLSFTNSNRSGEGKKSVMVAIIIQYGHATPSGSYVQGIDYINPVMQPIFESIQDRLWKEVSGSGQKHS